jgi:NAD(P)-dependent dehydrogenase (short-subunit alcohol dehydrogenase family)
LITDRKQNIRCDGRQQGIGRQIALSLARMGAEIVMMSRDQKGGMRARQEIIEEPESK